ncbi:electron transport complex subunit G [Spirochaetia bacterium]|nr:electron transport complex subunit G [Spirochaetia bacterium]
MKVWDTVKLGLVLMVYTAVACVGLAFVYGGTKTTIDERARIDLEASLQELFSSADGGAAQITFKEITGTIVSPDGAVSFETAYSISQNGTLIGAAIQASAGSYGGPIKVLVGVNANGTISRIKIMEHSDTPGLGAKAAKPAFYGQFAGKAVSDPFEPKQDVTAITAATITSRAVSRAVKTAGEAAAAWLAAEGAGR